MQNYRTACVIAKKENSFESYYISEFLKWTGWSYFNYSYDGEEENYILECPENNNFDIFICLNYQEASLSNLKKIEETIENSKLIAINTKDYNSEVDMLRAVFSKLAKQTNDFNDTIFQKLITIYDEYDMIPMLHSYTFTVLGNRDCECTNRMYGICLEIMEEVEELYKDIENQPWAEYCLYAKLHAKAKLNELCHITKRLPRYDTEKCMEEANEIYKYDQDFFRAEYLKEKFTTIDKRYAPSARDYIKNCIERCPVRSCRSFHHYTLGKSYENADTKLEMSIEYKNAYKDNKKNIRALFKIGIEYYIIKNHERSTQCFEMILDELDKSKAGRENIDPMNLEYIFKSYMLVARMSYEQKRNECYDYAEEIMKLVKKENKWSSIFMEKMYEKDTIPGLFELMSELMLERLGTKRLELRAEMSQ